MLKKVMVKNGKAYVPVYKGYGIDIDDVKSMFRKAKISYTEDKYVNYSVIYASLGPKELEPVIREESKNATLKRLDNAIAKGLGYLNSSGESSIVFMNKHNFMKDEGSTDKLERIGRTNLYYTKNKDKTYTAFLFKPQFIMVLDMKRKPVYDDFGLLNSVYEVLTF